MKHLSPSKVSSAQLLTVVLTKAGLSLTLLLPVPARRLLLLALVLLVSLLPIN
jgi:hypothetical protein